MKKLLKSEICGFVNSARYALIGWKWFDKSNFAATVYTQYMNSNRNNKICLKTRKEKKKKRANAKASTRPKRTLSSRKQLHS